MTAPRALPSTLASGFTFAAAREAGVSVTRLRASDLASPFHGTRTSGEVTGIERLRLLLAVLPPHTFAMGSTGAASFELPLPSAVEKTAFEEPMIGVAAPANRIRRPGVRGRSLVIPADQIGEFRGIRVTSPARTWLDLSPELSAADLVAVTDKLIHHEKGRCALADLLAIAAANPHKRGAAARATALRLANDHAESRRESLVRVLLVEAGLPTPECNPEIFDGPRFIARVGMLYRAHKLVIEYQGDHHRDPDRWSRDEIRRAELEALGYRVTYVTRRDFDHPEQLVARVRRLLAV